MAGWSWLLKRFPTESLPDVTTAAVPIPNPLNASPEERSASSSEAELSEGWELPRDVAETIPDNEARAAATSGDAPLPPESGIAAPDAAPQTVCIEPSESPGAGTASPSDRVPLARLRRNLVVVSGGLVRSTEPGVFTDWATTRVVLSETHPLLGLLLVSFSSESDARVQWRLVLGAEPNATILGRPVACKITARKPRSVTVYGVTAPLAPGEYVLRGQVSASPATSIAVHPSASAGAEYLRFLLFELL